MSSPACRWSRPAAVALLLSLSACATSPRGQQDDGNAPPFVFRALDLKQQDMLGTPTWSLSSPEARYDMRRRVAQADRPQGVIYRRGKPAFRLSAISGTVLNEGQVVLLEGRIRVEQLGERPMLIRADRARWFPSRNRLEIDRRPEVFDPNSRISARKAQFSFDTHQLRLRQTPLLEHWSQASDPLREAGRGRPEVVLHVAEADWNTESGTLSTRGPLRAVRRTPERAAGTPEQTLTAARLEGNTVSQLFWLRGPVRLVDPLENSELQTGDMRFDLRNHQASSGPAFTGQAGDPQTSSCRLQRGGDSLLAESCSWNWQTQAVEARGNVQLHRSEHAQSSRGGVLSGRLGRDGFLTLTNPGGRVISRLQLPPGTQPRLRPQLQRPRPAAQPIRL